MDFVVNNYCCKNGLVISNLELGICNLKICNRSHAQSVVNFIAYIQNFRYEFDFKIMLNYDYDP